MSKHSQNKSPVPHDSINDHKSLFEIRRFLNDQKIKGVKSNKSITRLNNWQKQRDLKLNTKVQQIQKDKIEIFPFHPVINSSCKKSHSTSTPLSFFSRSRAWILRKEENLCEKSLKIESELQTEQKINKDKAFILNKNYNVSSKIKEMIEKNENSETGGFNLFRLRNEFDKNKGYTKIKFNSRSPVKTKNTSVFENLYETQKTNEPISFLLFQQLMHQKINKQN